MIQPMPLQPRDKWPDYLDEKLVKYFSHTEIDEGFLSEEELVELMMHMFHTFKRPRYYKGGTFKFEKFDCDFVWEMLYPKLKNKFSWLEKYDILDGNGYITGTNYSLHMDSCNPSVFFNTNQLAVKSFIIPLFVCKPENDRDSQFILFKNRLLGWECNFSNGSSNDVKLAYQQNVVSYRNLPWKDVEGNLMYMDYDNLCVDEDFYNDHLSHLPKETFHGMVLEKMVPFKPKSILIFDPYQPHVTADKKWSKTNLKGGIRFNIQRKVDKL